MNFEFIFSGVNGAGQISVPGVQLGDIASAAQFVGTGRSAMNYLGAIGNGTIQQLSTENLSGVQIDLIINRPIEIDEVL